MIPRTRVLVIALAVALPVAAAAILGRDDRRTECAAPDEGGSSAAAASSDSLACAPASEPPCLASRIGLPCRE